MRLGTKYNLYFGRRAGPSCSNVGQHDQNRWWMGWEIYVCLERTSFYQEHFILAAHMQGMD